MKAGWALYGWGVTPIDSPPVRGILGGARRQFALSELKWSPWMRKGDLGALYRNAITPGRPIDVQDRFMGMNLVGLLHAKWAPYLSGNAFRVAAKMAFTALDEDSPTRPRHMYFHDRSELMSILDDCRGGDVNSKLRVLERAIAELVAVGAIERANRAHAGRRANYRMRLDTAIDIDRVRTARLKKPDNEGGAVPDNEGGAFRTKARQRTHESPTTNARKPDNEGGAKEKEGEEGERRTKEQREGTVDDLGPRVTTARDPDEKKDTENNCTNFDCWNGYVIDPKRTKAQGRAVRCPDCHPPTEDWRNPQ